MTHAYTRADEEREAERNGLKMFTVEIQHGTKANEPDWLVRVGAHAVKVGAWMTADEVAEAAARRHARAAELAGGEHFRVVVWNGSTRGRIELPVSDGASSAQLLDSVIQVDSVAEFYSDMLDEECKPNASGFQSASEIASRLAGQVRS